MLRGLVGVMLVLTLADAAGVTRGGRWYSRETKTITRVVKQRQTVTEPTPSSCVVVQTSLPPCRHLRSVQPTPSVKIMQTGLPSASGQGWKPILQPSDPIPPQIPIPAKSTPLMATTTAGSGWGWDFFNLGTKEVIVTKTIREIHTSKYMDPNTVVTFSVKGCRPSRLPFDLPECKPPRLVTITPHNPPPQVPERGVIVMAPIQFVPAVEGISPMSTVQEEPEETEKKAEVGKEEVKLEDATDEKKETTQPLKT